METLIEHLQRLAWDHLLPAIADRLGPEEYEIAYLLHLLETAPDELSEGELVKLCVALAVAGVI